MKVYIDFDDVLSETAKAFSVLVKDMFAIDVPYEKIHFFDLKKSFNLTDVQYEDMMVRAHQPESLLAYDEVTGAVDTINEWVDKGHEVYIITGRPSSAYDASRQWLDEHNLDRVKLYCVDKYGRDSFIKNSEFSISLEEYYKMHFDFAVEDSPAAFKHLEHLKDCTVAVITRPWNETSEFPRDNYVRCYDWNEISNLFESAISNNQK